jgi:hypothetical protein
MEKLDYCFRIYTEDINRKGIREILKKHFDVWTEFTGIGYYHGAYEDSLIIEILSANCNGQALTEATEEIRQLNRQECVIVSATKQPSAAITGPGWQCGHVQRRILDIW